MRDKLKEKLEKISDKVFYGLVPETKEKELNQWNYIVFGQDILSKAGTSGVDFAITYSITIVQEDFISDELISKVINSVLSIPGMRLSEQNYDFNYISKGKSDVVVEILTILFIKSVKGCKLLSE